MAGYKSYDEYDVDKINPEYFNTTTLKICQQGMHYALTRYHEEWYRIQIHFNKVSRDNMQELGRFFLTDIQPYLARLPESANKKSPLRGEGSPNPTYSWQYDIQIYPFKFKRGEYTLRDLLRMLKAKFNK